ncbi:MAG: hypothetical protein MUF00_08600 [Gemmatimonadaceae bacterium]|jgi:hypothetical protein|nr:hypothetical protein [Gemmatimonadaceae bacterium]
MTVVRSASAAVRSRVRHALRESFHPGAEWRTASAVQRRNLLLDAVGSDHRPLVDLLLFAEERGVPARLPTDPLTGDRWELVHAQIALDFAARTFVQIDAARWAVETWAFAMGIVGDEQLERIEPEPAPLTRPASAPPARAPSAVHVPPRTRATGAPPSSRAAAPSLPPRSVAAAMAARILPPGPRWRTSAPPTAARHLAASAAWSPRDATAVVIAITMLVIVPAAVVVSDHRREVDRAAIREAALAPSVAASRPPTPSPSPALAPASVASADAAATRIADRLAPDHPVARGLGGRYRLEITNVEVSGSASCSQVAQRIAARQPTTEEIAHVPGTPTFRFTSRPGLIGEVDSDGRFRTNVAHGMTNGVEWRTRLSGSFAGDSLVAVSESESAGVLAWRETQECRALTSFVGRRLAAASSAPSSPLPR